jgi:hypothetical protein
MSMNAADRLQRQAQSLAQPERGKVLAFPGSLRAPVPAAANRFSMKDRMTAYSWAEDARSLGYSRLVFEPAAEIDGVQAGEFLLIYGQNASWSAWGVGCDTDGLTLWHSPRGTTIGRFQSMHEALSRIQELSLQR